VIDGDAGAFAGARAGFSAMGGVAGATYGAEAEAWAGVGAKASWHCGIEDGKFKFETGIGVAVGVGAFFKLDTEIDLHDPGAVASGILGLAGGALGMAFGGLPAAVVGAVVAGTSGKGAGDILGGIFGAVSGLFGGGAGDGSHATAVLNDTVTKLAGNAAGSLGVPGLGDTPPQKTSTVWKSDDDIDPERAASFDDRFSNLE